MNKTKKTVVKNVDEHEFVKALKKGENWAYEKLYEDFAPLVGSIARSFLRQDDVEDIIQEVMIRVYKGIKKFRGDSKLSTWIHRIAVNVCKDALSRRKRRNEFLVSFTESDENDDKDTSYIAFTQEDVISEVLNEMNYKKILSALEKLSPENRLLIQLRDIEGLSYEEIAEIMNKPIGTVKSRLHYARKKLKELTEGGG